MEAKEELDDRLNNDSADVFHEGDEEEEEAYGDGHTIEMDYGEEDFDYEEEEGGGGQYAVGKEDGRAGGGDSLPNLDDAAGRPKGS